MTNRTQTPPADPAPITAAAKKVMHKPTAPATMPTPAKGRTPAAKAAVQPAVKSEAPAKARASKAEKPAKAEKENKVRKPKLVRDSFTIPKDEYAAIDELKLRSARLAHHAKKSELLRAGLKLLTTLDDPQLLAALQAVPAIKTGRPAKNEDGKASKK